MCFGVVGLDDGGAGGFVGAVQDDDGLAGGYDHGGEDTKSCGWDRFVSEDAEHLTFCIMALVLALCVRSYPRQCSPWISSAEVCRFFVY